MNVHKTLTLPFVLIGFANICSGFSRRRAISVGLNKQDTYNSNKHGQTLVTVCRECVITDSYRSSQVRTTKITPFYRYPKVYGDVTLAKADLQ